MKENVIIELVTVDKIVPIANGPTNVTVKMRELSRNTKGNAEIEFIAKGTSESGIEFYSWDFNHDEKEGFKASVMIDYEGKQTRSFNAGEHLVAIKAVDNNGLESIETFKIKVNGVVKKV